MCLSFLHSLQPGQDQSHAGCIGVGWGDKNIELGFIFVIFDHRSNLICAILLKFKMTLEKAEWSSRIHMGTYVFNYLMNNRKQWKLMTLLNGIKETHTFQGASASNLWHCMQALFMTQIVTINCPQRGHKFRETESLYGVVSRMEIWDWSVKWAV